MELPYNPKVSIVIPVYNGANFLSSAIDSALCQTYENIEIIVVNDGSKDDDATERIALSYGTKIRYIYKENGGVSSALNAGIKAMTGEWFSWLSHDDVYSSEKISHSIKALNKLECERSKIIIYTDGCWVREDLSEIMSFHKYFEPHKIHSGLEAAEIMSRKGTLFGCNFLIHRTAFEEVGFFDETLRYSQDSLMWYKLFLKGYSVYYSDTKDVFSRMHKNQVTNTRKDLFVHDSMVIAKILAPEFALVKGEYPIYYNYVKRLTRLKCEETVNYLIDYAEKNSILTKSELKKLSFEKSKGRFIYKIKALVKKITLR